MKHLTLFVVLYLSLFGVAFGQEEAALKQDLQQYLKEAQGWGPVEARINGPLDKAQRSHFVNDQLVISTLRPVVPLVQDYVGKLAGYHPETPALQDVHRQYIGVWRSHQLACETIVEAMEKKDYILLSKGTANLTEARAALLAVLDGLSELLVKAGLRPPPETGSAPSAAPRGPFPPGNE